MRVALFTILCLVWIFVGLGLATFMYHPALAALISIIIEVLCIAGLLIVFAIIFEKIKNKK